MASLIRLSVDAVSGNLRPKQPLPSTATPRDAAGNPLSAPYSGQTPTQEGWYYQARPNETASAYGPVPVPIQSPHQNGHNNGGRRGRRGTPRVGPNGERRGLAGLIMMGINAAQNKSKKPKDPSSDTATAGSHGGPSSSTAVAREEEDFDEHEYFGEVGRHLSECPPYQPGEHQGLVDTKTGDNSISPPPLAPSSSRQSDSWQSNNPFRNDSSSMLSHPPSSTS